MSEKFTVRKIAVKKKIVFDRGDDILFKDHDVGSHKHFMFAFN